MTITTVIKRNEIFNQAAMADPAKQEKRLSGKYCIKLECRTVPCTGKKATVAVQFA